MPTAVVGPASAVVNGKLLVIGGSTNPLAAAATGKVLAFGRKPWLGLAFGSLLAAP